MALSSGSRIGPYEVTALIGEGGMGQVYRARDPRLGRDVAVKILPPAFAVEPERIARFEREAKVLATLNHPNIAAIYGVEEAALTVDGSIAAFRALVMELVEGPTLADHLAEGAVPIGEALAIARQIADALEAAHEQGIVHRDLKPANIKLRPDGTVKVLDFGLAKAIEPAHGAAAVSQLPTITTPAMTQAGVILGTAAYMSPEQARGRPADKRSDVWAFGCVLFEMVTGHRAFTGADVGETLAAVIKDEPDWRALPAGSPAALDRLLRRCLAKNPLNRLSSMADARLELADAAVLGAAPPEGRSVPAAKWRRVLPWAIGGTAGFLLGVLALSLTQGTPAGPAEGTTMRLSIDPGVRLQSTSQSDVLALSPDGTMVAFRAADGLYVRRLDRLEAERLDIRNGNSPFFSPDGKWIGFFSDRRLQKISVSGGAPVVICDVPNISRGAAWGEDGYIVFNASPLAGSALMRVPETGGTPESVTSLREGEATHRWPQVLPGARFLLYTALSSANSAEGANIVAQPLQSGEARVIVRGAFFARYLSSGHLLFVRDGTLFATRFDPQNLEPGDDAVPLVQGIANNTSAGNAQYAVSDTGALLYQAGASSSSDAALLWLHRDGTTSALDSERYDWRHPRFAPDGRSIAINVDDGRQSDIYVYDWARELSTRVTYDSDSHETTPVWTPDGRRITFTSTRGAARSQADRRSDGILPVLNGPTAIYWQRVDGTGDAQRLTSGGSSQAPGSWHPDGRRLAYEERETQSRINIRVLTVTGNEASGWRTGESVPFVTGGRAFGPEFSPDGRWIAYQSGESNPEGSGGPDVFVRPFPGPGGRWQISSGGGRMPTWSRARNELFYVDGENRIMVVPYRVDGDVFRVEKPQLWTKWTVRLRPGIRAIDLHPDGQRYAVADAAEPEAGTSDRLVFLSNVVYELQRLLPSR